MIRGDRPADLLVLEDISLSEPCATCRHELRDHAREPVNALHIVLCYHLHCRCARFLWDDARMKYGYSDEPVRAEKPAGLDGGYGEALNYSATRAYIANDSTFSFHFVRAVLKGGQVGWTRVLK